MQKQPAVTFGCAEDEAAYGGGTAISNAGLLVHESHLVVCDKSESLVEGAAFIGSVK